MTFPILLGTIGLGGAYSLYAIFAAISGICAWKFVRETQRTQPRADGALSK